MDSEASRTSLFLVDEMLEFGRTFELIAKQSCRSRRRRGENRVDFGIAAELFQKGGDR